MVAELIVEEAGVQHLAHVHLDEVGAAVAQRGEVGVVQLAADFDAAEVGEVEIVAHPGKDFVGEDAGLFDGDVEQGVGLALLLVTEGNEAVQDLVVGGGAGG